MARILAVDDEANILTLIRNVLSRDGHDVVTAVGADKIPENGFARFDLILLDVMMPGLDGVTLCREIRDRVDCPILFLTAKTQENDIVFGLGAGADDYITKPFGAGELRARVNAHLCRENRQKRSAFSVGGACFNLTGKEITVGGEKVDLTKSEYRICEFLAHNRGQVFSRERIYEEVYGFDGESDGSAITEHIKNIRAKLGAFGLSPIETVWGIGYKWR